MSGSRLKYGEEVGSRAIRRESEKGCGRLQLPRGSPRVSMVSLEGRQTSREVLSFRSELRALGLRKPTQPLECTKRLELVGIERLRREDLGWYSGT